VLIVGSNPRLEAPLVNTRLRKAYLHLGATIYNIGPATDLTYPVKELGNDPRILNQILSADHEVAKALSGAERPALILGSAAVARDDGPSIMNATKTIADQCGLIKDGWNGFNMLHYGAARVGGLDIGFVPQKGGKDIAGIIEAIDKKEIEAVYLHGVDEIDMSYFGEAFVIYQGHHGDIGAHRADVILPGAAYTEKDAIYVNTEGRPQEAFRAVFPPGDAKEDWKIIRALSDTLGHTLPYDTLEQLRERVVDAAPQLAVLDEVTPATWKPVAKPSKSYRIKQEAFERVFLNFYMTDPISRASKTMAECSQAMAERRMQEEGKQAA